MKKYIAEALGTGFLAFTAISTGGDPFAIAAVLAIFIYAYADVSGAHFNLSVTAAMWSRGEISCYESIKYAAAQVIGAVIAIAVALMLLGEPLFAFGSITGSISMSQIASEFLAAFVLLTAIFACLRSDVHPAWGVAIAHIVLVSIGMMINTSITLATFTNGNALLTVIILAIAQIVGGIVAGRLDKTMAA